MRITVFPATINRQTDIEVWKAKAANMSKEGNRVKFKVQELTSVIADSCPKYPDKPAIVTYLRRVMLSKVRFERYNNLGFPVTEEMFKRIWLERLNQDKGYGEVFRNMVKARASMRVTISSLIESLASHLQLDYDPKALFKYFDKSVQGPSEEVRAYVWRKFYEAQAIVPNGNHDVKDLVELVIRGMRDEQAVKFRLIRKFGKRKFKTFKQLEEALASDILEHE